MIRATTLAASSDNSPDNPWLLKTSSRARAPVTNASAPAM